MSITSYAQNFEDVMLWRALGHVPKGFYIDIGAQHPVTDSVSKAFYEKGWRGIHVEATPAYAALLRQDRPDEIVIEAAVNDVNGIIPFFEIPATGISTGDPDIARSHQDRGFNVREIVVPCITLEDIFNQVGDKDIHWLKVDVECMEHQVLLSWGLSLARPWVVVVESTVPLTPMDNHFRWVSSLLERGYTQAYFDGLNRYYLAADQQHLASAFVSGPNVFDGFTLSGDASAPFCVGINDKHHRIQQALQDQLSAKDEQSQQLQNELQAKEKEACQLNEQHAKQAAQHQELASKWQAQLQALQGRNKEAEHAHTVQKYALQELASQRYQEAQSQANNHLQNLVQREQTFAAQLLTFHSKLNTARQSAQQLKIDLGVESREREQVLLVKAAADLQQVTDQAQARLDALSQSHLQKQNALQAEKTQLLQRLEQARAEYQKQFRALESEAHVRELALLSKAAADLLQANHQTQVRLDALSQSSQKREQAHQAEKNLLLQRLEEAKAVIQKNLQDWVHREQALAQKQHDLQELHHQQSQAWTVVHRDLANSIAKLSLQIESLQSDTVEKAREYAKALDDQRAQLECRNSALQISLVNQTFLTSELQRELAALRRTWWKRVFAFLGLEAVDVSVARDADLGLQKMTIQLAVEPHESAFEIAGVIRTEFTKQENPMTLDQLLKLPSDSFIRVAYQLIFGREADQAELQHYLSKLRNGVGRAGVLYDLMNSKEANEIGPMRDLAEVADEAYISALYWRILGRAPDPEGLLHYQKVIRKSGGRRRIFNDIYVSAEAFKRDPIKANFHRELTQLFCNVGQSQRWWKWKSRPAKVLGEVHLLGELIADVAGQVDAMRSTQELFFQNAVTDRVTKLNLSHDGQTQDSETVVAKLSIFELVQSIDGSHPNGFVEQLSHVIAHSAEAVKLTRTTLKQ